MSNHKFKVGDKVLLDPNKCSKRDLRQDESNGVIGKEYIIVITSMDADPATYILDGVNWHKEDWLTKVVPDNIIGGKLNGRKRDRILS